MHMPSDANTRIMCTRTHTCRADYWIREYTHARDWNKCSRKLSIAHAISENVIKIRSDCCKNKSTHAHVCETVRLDFDGNLCNFCCTYRMYTLSCVHQIATHLMMIYWLALCSTWYGIRIYCKLHCTDGRSITFKWPDNREIESDSLCAILKSIHRYK